LPVQARRGEGSLCVNLEEEDDDAGPSRWRGGDGGQGGCSTWAAKNELPSDDEDNSNRNKDYDVFYRRLSMI
jgi:hypothetical protein